MKTEIRNATARTALIDVLRKKRWTVAFAESCTGGRLSAMITELGGVSDIFLGSVISYANAAKRDLLDVSDETLKKFGAVSEETAVEMVRGARKRLHADVAVAITGIAGPTGGTPEKPVGTVCFAAAGPGFESATTQLFSGERIAVQAQAAGFAMEFLRQAIKTTEK